ncbi:MAG: efflux RND transporter periplasmic adaptor subunit [Dysgonamonadaceae bacterium]|jgi:RND family efflux transporter MFP subunit|nr:efflux RND transporter periplasmic adaptor subunit [Dysgonamonadaceae bacterium]
MKSIIIDILMVAAMLFAGCHAGDHDHAAKVTHDHVASGEHDHSDEIHFSPQQAQAVGLLTEEVQPGIFSFVIKTGGQILSAQGDEATVAATSSGIVTFDGSAVADGAAVKAGATIVTISAKNLAEGDPAAKTKFAYETALKAYQRAEELAKDQIISAKELEQTRLQYETAKTAYEAQSANISANGVRVVSPLNGYIKNRLVNQGEYVSVGQPIVTISQNRRLQLRAEVSENYFKSLKNIGTANFQTSYDPTVYKLSDLSGRLLAVGKASNGQSFHIPVTFEFDNIGDIIPGSFVTVYLLSNEQADVISIPVTAVTEEQGLNFVYLQMDEDGYKKQEVTLGQSNGDRVQVLKGLNAGDKVVTKGVYQVKLASVSSVMPEGHSHNH